MLPSPRAMRKVAESTGKEDYITSFLEHVSEQIQNAAYQGEKFVVVESHTFVNASGLIKAKTIITDKGYQVTEASRLGDVIKISWA